MNIPNVILFSFDESFIDVPKTKGVIGLTYINICKNVIPLCQNSDLSIMIIAEDQIDNYFDDIVKISFQSEVSIVFVINQKKDAIHTKLMNLVDTVIPFTSNRNDLYWSVRSLVEPFTLNCYEGNNAHQFIGVDITDIHYITRSKGIAQSIIIDIESIDSLSNELSAEYVKSSSGVLISIIAAEVDVSMLERIDKMVRPYINHDNAVVSSLIDDKRMTEGKIVLIFTGIQ